MDANIWKLFLSFTRWVKIPTVMKLVTKLSIQGRAELQHYYVRVKVLY